ncbi:MAG: protein kinase [Myxococcota bacterium]
MPGPETSVEPDLSGTVLGRYRLVRRLGLGGMGAVYLAQHELLDRKAAVKVLNQSLASRSIARKRFLLEARAASKVHHPGVVEIHDVAFAGNVVYFVMELLEGHDLGELLQEQPRLGWEQAAPIFIQVADALDAAHRVGVIHRDVKPSNCFLLVGAGGFPGPDVRDKPDVRVKMVDFGIAKVATGDRSVTEELTITGEIFGTVAYMAPEMGQGISDDPRSDIYGLGVMMFRVLTGRLPFVGNSVQVITQHISQSPPAPRSLEPSIPVEVERIILQALEKQPEDRQPSMQHVASALRKATRRSHPGASPDLSSSGMASRSRPPRTPIAPVRPSVPITQAEVIGLDERPTAPRSARRADDPWREEHARTTAYGEEPLPPPMPGEVELPPEMFRPPEDPSVQVDLSAVTQPSHEVAAVRPSRRRLVRGLAAGGVLAAVGTVAWVYRDRVTQVVPKDLDELQRDVGLSDEADHVLVLVDVVPEGANKDAKVYIDDVWITERPIRVPRSEDYVQIRVEADGYEPWRIRFKPTITRRFEVKLERSPRKGKKKARKRANNKGG